MRSTKASTNSAMLTLSEKGLIVNEKYRKVFLTDEGFELAKLIAEKHSVIHNFLIKILKVPPQVAEKDACAIEHVIAAIRSWQCRSFCVRIKIK